MRVYSIKEENVFIVCRDCGSQDVRRDAWAEWDAERQQWFLGALFDQGYCEACGEEATLEEKAM